MSDFKPCPPIPDLMVGDVLLYAPTDAIGWIIAAKTWTWLAHCEVYAGAGRVIAARIAGVNNYAERIDKSLRFIRRPVMPPDKPFDSTAAYKAVEEHMGKPYSVPALFEFYDPLNWLHKSRVSNICSSIVTAYVIGGGCSLFNPELSPDDVSPAQLWQTNDLTTIWTRSTKAKCEPPLPPSSP
jgi:hypothetical protein